MKPVQRRLFATVSSLGQRDYQYLQRSTLPLEYFQASLPRLPIPELPQTCNRYLAAVKPICDDVASYERTVRICEEFQKEEGPRLHADLNAYDKAHPETSYISAPWFRMYLADRQPLPVNYNPLIMWKSDKLAAMNDQCARATNICVSAGRFLKSLYSSQLAPEVFCMGKRSIDDPLYRRTIGMLPAAFKTYGSYAFKNYPLDVSQYKNLFYTTRIPRENTLDEIRQTTTKAKHILVIRNGEMYTLDVLNDIGDLEDPGVIYRRINYILQRPKSEEMNPIGVMTAQNRNIWAKGRSYLKSLSSVNAENFDRLESAMFCLCLDDSGINQPPEDFQELVPLVRQFLYGNATNRWFDKSLQVIVDGSGISAINFEHSWGDGVAVLRLFNEVYKEISTEPWFNEDLFKNHKGHQSDETVKKLEFTMDAKVNGDIAKAMEFHSNVEDSLKMSFLKYDRINKPMCKNYGLSPDSIMQLGMQLAYYLLKGDFVSTYESCSTAAFRHGRTETMRPCTMKTKEFCQHVIKDASAYGQLRVLIDECSKLHGQMTKAAAMGQGFDRHLFGLKWRAQELGLKIPDLYEDSNYHKLQQNIISTSTLSADGLLAGGFGPVSLQGFGIAYNIQNDFLGTVTTGYKKEMDVDGFIDCLSKAYDLLYNVIVNASNPRK